ncbi:MAG: hypothetical protein EOP84_00360 [Verrucomicrobiaceae bacterium]|nr:MAG: hypothetical protein EOP84_00360 [Verrucomicrobiaceae bacterium]
MKIGFGLIVSALLALPASAQEACEDLVGKTIQTSGFEATTKPFAKLPPKDEFETTEQYETRLAQATSGLPTTLFIPVPFSAEYAPYNADKQQFEIDSYAVVNLPIDWISVFSVTEPFQDHGKDIGMFVEQQEKPTGSYQATNAFGTKAKIVKVTTTTSLIHDRRDKDYLSDILPKRGYTEKVAWNLAATPDAARQLKGKLRAAVMIAPKAPYFLELSGHTRPPTLSLPIEESPKYRVLFADIRCIVITDDRNEVLVSQITS